MIRRRWMAGAALIAVVAVGCGSTSEPDPEAPSATICRHLQDVAIEMTQEWIDGAERIGVTIEEWEASPDAPFGDGQADDLVKRTDVFVEEWNGYDCAGEAFDVVRWRDDELVYATPVGEYVVERFANRE
jgi:hypothetical protein